MKKLLFVSIISSLFIFSACDDDNNDDVQLPGTLEIEFDNVAVIDGKQTQLRLASPESTDYTFQNAMGQEFNINLLRYFISEIVLEGPNGEYYEDEMSVSVTAANGYYLIDESKASSQLITLKNIPAGKYNKVTFTVGVDEAGVTEGAAGGVLDPATNNMFWNWNSGYVAVKFEGQSAASPGGANGETVQPTNANGFAYHLGGWRDMPGTAFVYNNKRLSFTFDVDATVNESQNPHVHMIFDVLTLLNDSKMIDFSSGNNVHRPIDGADMANNIPAAFNYDHLHQ